MGLADEQCQRGAAPLSPQEAHELVRSVPLWSPAEKQIEREFKFGDFRRAMVFVNRVADLAERQGHHPDILISYSRVRLILSTHEVGGLSRSDFILAAGVDRLASESGLSA